ncbi:MAG: topoisomerase DNA-binding C4 zinc finger domain-containing protein, partial [Fibromonadaceae bacterium]|nr:topoisomerase DNA-binding C4 zinc finger domain-containing protein [Fibromonadaceae bacterium]
LIEYIKKEDAASKGFNSSEAEMWMFAKRFLDMHRKRNADYTQKYINKDIECKTKDPIANKSSAVENTAKPNPSLSEDKIICSKCGAPMVKRKVSSKGKDVGKEFWGCSKFPSCRNTVGLS